MDKVGEEVGFCEGPEDGLTDGAAVGALVGSSDNVGDKVEGLSEGMTDDDGAGDEDGAHPSRFIALICEPKCEIKSAYQRYKGSSMQLKSHGLYYLSTR